jgi:two-component system chemotaxis response regulator CheB
MIVDDSPVARRLLERVLGRSGFEVVAELSDGARVVETARAERVEVVVLDRDMPERSGDDAVQDLLQSGIQVGVVIYAGAANETLEALRRKTANSLPCRVVPKGAGAGGGIDVLSETLLPMVMELGEEIRQRKRLGALSGEAGLARRERERHGVSVSTPSPPSAKPALPVGPEPRDIGLLLVGASTGGPDALLQLLRPLPADFPIPGAVVQHMPAGFTEQLAKRLNDQCAIEIREAKNGELLQPGCILVAPGGKHLEIQGGGAQARTVLTKAEPENSCRPAVDVLFRTGARTKASPVLAVVLTGMGQDGVAGLKHIQAAGGWSIVQDQETSVVWGMPGAAVKAGVVHEVLPLQEISGRIVELVSRRQPNRRVS